MPLLGSSIATPTAAPWVTDFLNAAFYARPRKARSLDDLRLAWGIVTTAWEQRGRSLGARDLPGFHAAFGPLRLLGRRGGRWGTLDRDALLRGGDRLLGSWFSGAWPDDERRAYGIAFQSVDARERHDPQRRLRAADPGPLTPHRAPPGERHWGTYPSVTVPDPDAALRFVQQPERWPDAGTAAGRFTPLRSGGLLGQTFEIEVVAPLVPRVPAIVRGHVTCTRLLTAGVKLDAYARELDATLAEHADDARPPFGEGSDPLAAFELTTHEGHFLGAGVSRILLFRRPDGTHALRDCGSWDPLPWDLAMGFRTVGAAAQQAFWGRADPDASLLVQIAAVSAGRGGPAAAS